MSYTVTIVVKARSLLEGIFALVRKTTISSLVNGSKLLHQVPCSNCHHVILIQGNRLMLLHGNSALIQNCKEASRPSSSLLARFVCHEHHCHFVIIQELFPSPLVTLELYVFPRADAGHPLGTTAHLLSTLRYQTHPALIYRGRTNRSPD